jgi:single-strand DNA-binding protein
MSVNKVILLGNLGKDPLVRYIDADRVVATVTLATNETFTGKNGERTVETEWHNLEMWDSLAKIAEKYLKKGMQVYVEGKIKSEAWKDKQGTEHIGKKIRVTSFTMLSSKQPSDNQPNSSAPLPPISNNSSEVEDDLPF